MNFDKGYIYHIYNQGNNQRQVFIKTENYYFFLRKVKEFLLPYTDILAWCLMPNHFHFMVLIKEMELLIDDNDFHTMTQSHRMNKKRTLNDSIAIMLRSYTRAINKQKGTSGSIFRPHTKAECINCPNGISASWIVKDGITEINITNPEKQYPQICFDYIHQNPVKAKLVLNPEDWEFSSYKDYAGLRDGKLINRQKAGEYLIIG